jgi:hypothetical protein
VKSKEITWVVNRNNCWNCNNHNFDRNGYPNKRINGKIVYLSRYMYEKHVGIIPAGIFVLHHCDNPSCINPDHLFLGTQQDNMRDKKEKGRAPFGENHCCAKLNENQVKYAIKSKLSQRKIANLFGVGRSAIKGIREHKTWKHLIPDPDGVFDQLEELHMPKDLSKQPPRLASIRPGGERVGKL